MISIVQKSLVEFLSRRFISKSTRNKAVKWIGSHKEPLTEEQRLRRRRKHKPFVLGRDNVERNFEPSPIPELQVTKENAPYLVKRTENGYLPVYTDYRNARSRQLTIIRRVEGSIENLCNDLKNILPEQNTVQIRKPANHVWIKGNVSRHVRYWLTSIGF